MDILYASGYYFEKFALACNLPNSHGWYLKLFQATPIAICILQTRSHLVD